MCVRRQQEFAVPNESNHFAADQHAKERCTSGVRDWPELEPCPLHADPGPSPAEEKPSAQVWVRVAEERPVTSAMQEREDTPLVSV